MPLHILISGAGIAGLTFAYCCRRAGYSCTIVEKSGAVRPAGYMIDFFGSGYDAAERLGLLSDIEQIHYPIDKLSFVDSHGHERFALSYHALRKIFYNRHFNFLRGDLERVLYSHVKDFAHFRFGVTIESIEQHTQEVIAHLSDGSSVHADLLLGADGIHSRVRSLVFGEESRFLRFLGYNTAAYILPFLPSGLRSDNVFTTLTVPAHQVGFYPIRDGRLAAFFLYRAQNPPAAVDPAAGFEELRSAFSGAGWVVPRLFDGIEPGSFYFDQVSQIEAPHWSRGRVILLGDACYCVSLLAGQGSSLAMAGAYVLAQKLQASAGDVAVAAAFYENRLRPHVEKKQLAARKFARWFVPASNAMISARDSLMRLSNYSLFRPMVRRSFSPDSLFRGPA